MHLIGPLAAGMRGCDNGTVGIFRRGTGTRATYYTSFEAAGSTTPVADIALDSLGRLKAYVNEVVDVVCKNSAGATIITFTDGVSASCVEYIGPSFTGTDYVGGATGINKPITVKAVLDLWATSSGDTDFEVGGSALDDALVGASSLLFNVKSYGAVGDGVANDRAAITSAIAAAVAAGGGEVFFPGGTYRIGSAITASAKVNLRGASPLASIILVDYASDATGAVRTTVSGASGSVGNVLTQLTIRPAQTFTGPLVQLRQGCALYQCVVGDPSGAVEATQCVVVSSTGAEIYECRINVVGVAGIGILNSGTTQYRLSGGSVQSLTASFTGDLVRLVATCRALVFGVNFERNTATSAAACVALTGNGNELTMSSCKLQASAQSYLIDLGSDTGAIVYESGNAINQTDDGTVGRLYNAGTATLSAPDLRLLSREMENATINDDGAAVTIDTLNYGNIVLRRTTTGAQTVTFTTAPAGCRLSLTYYNDQGSGGGTITFDTSKVKMEAASNQFTVAANSFRVFEFRSVLIGSTLYWAQVAEDTVDEAE